MFSCFMMGTFLALKIINDSYNVGSRFYNETHEVVFRKKIPDFVVDKKQLDFIILLMEISRN